MHCIYNVIEMAVIPLVLTKLRDKSSMCKFAFQKHMAWIVAFFPLNDKLTEDPLDLQFLLECIRYNSNKRNRESESCNLTVSTRPVSKQLGRRRIFVNFAQSLAIIAYVYGRSSSECTPINSSSKSSGTCLWMRAIVRFNLRRRLVTWNFTINQHKLWS